MKIYTFSYLTNLAVNPTQSFFVEIFFCIFIRICANFTINYRSSLQYETKNTEYKNDMNYT